MSQRPNRPTEDFLHKIGIFHLPPNIDIVFDDCRGYFDRRSIEWISHRAFIVTQVDDKGEPALKTSVNAFETAAHDKTAIYKNLRDTLVSQFNAVPIQQGLRTDLSAARRARPPSSDFLQKVGVSRLPDDVDITFRSGEACATAFIIQKIGRDGAPLRQAEIPARTSAARGPGLVWGKVGSALIEFGALPAEKPPELGL